MIGWDIASEEDGFLPEGYERAPPEALETIIDALTALGPQVAGIMHSSFKSTTPGLKILFERWNGTVMAYPEAAGFDAVSRGTIPVRPDDFANHCRGWGREGRSDHRRLLRDDHPPHPRHGGPIA